MALPITLSLIVLLLCASLTEAKNIREKRDIHKNATWVEDRSFIRDSVEGAPNDKQWRMDENITTISSKEEFGSKSLPLRAAVESIPDNTWLQERLPLRDAVERRPPPDEPLDVSDPPATIRPSGLLNWEASSGDDIKQQITGKLDFNTPQYQQVEVPQMPVEQPPAFYGQPVPSYPQLLYIPPQLPLSIGGALLYPPGLQQQYTLYSPLQQYKRLLLLPEQTPAITVPSTARGLQYENTFIGVGGITSNPYSSPKRIVCYIEGIASYRREPFAFNPPDLDPKLCTHVVYAYATVDPLSHNLISNDEEYDIVQGGYRSALGLKLQNPSLKILLSIRLTPYSRLAALLASPEASSSFVRSVSAFLDRYPFDGIDLDWEWADQKETRPSQAELGQQDQLLGFLRELAIEVGKKGGILALSTPINRITRGDGWELAAKMADIVEYVTVKAYNFEKEGNANSSLDMDRAVLWWERRGMPSRKLVLGVPFFGRSSPINPTQDGSQSQPASGAYTLSPGRLAYFEICDALMPSSNDDHGWRTGRRQDDTPYATDGRQWVRYEDEESITRKVEFVNKRHLGGVSVIYAEDDDFRGLCGEKWPLLTTINREMKGADGQYSDPTNCAAYYNCQGGVGRRVTCDPPNFYNPEKGECSGKPEDCKPGAVVYVPKKETTDTRAVLKNGGAAEQNKPKVVCYVTSWSFYRKSGAKFVPENIDQRLCTHVVYAFASLDPERLQIKEFDAWADLNNNLYERITSLEDVQVLLSVGGWTDSSGDKYSRLVSDGSARRRFVLGAVAFLRKHRFNGLHLDWNYPVCWQSDCKRGPSTDKANFAKLLQELKSEFSKQSPPLILAAAISGYKEVIDVAYDLPVLGQNLDFMSVMTYDYHGAWERLTGHVSPLYGSPADKYPQYNVNYTMEYLVRMGAPRSKLLVGVPFYGQSFGGVSGQGEKAEGIPAAGPGDAGEYTKQPGVLAYYEVCNRVRQQGWKKGQGKGGPYAYKGDQWVGYEDRQSVKQKANYALQTGFGGAVAWTIDLDDFTNRCCGGAFPLLRALNEGLGLSSATTAAQEDCSPPPEPSTPPPPPTTTASDSGASTRPTEHDHDHWSTTTSKPVTWWSTTSATTTKKPSKQTTTSPWWTTSSTKPTVWWSTSSTTTTTTNPPSTSPWWTTATTKRPSKPTTTPRPSSSSTTESPSTVIPPTSVVQPDLPPPSSDQSPPSCQPGQYLPDPYNCNAFYRCVLGEPKKQYCAGGLHWNRNKNICDWPREAKCETASEASHSKPSTTKPTTRRPSSSTTSSWQHHQSSTTTPKAPSSSKCNSPGSYYPHSDCTKFYVCLGGLKIAQQCAPGLRYDPRRHMCDWSSKVPCDGGNRRTHPLKVGQAQPYSSCSGDAFAPLPGDCTRYMHCQWGKFEVRKCAPGLHWNNERKICDWPHSARCSEQTDNELDTENANPDEEPIDEMDNAPPTTSQMPPTAPSPVTTTTDNGQWSPPPTEWVEPASPSTESPWEWHPPIPPTSEQPPLSEPLKPFSGYFKLVCYFTNWAWYRPGAGKYLPEDIDSNLCTHIVYGFAVLDYSNLVIKAHDSWADFDNQFYKRVVGYKSKGVKVSIAIGGWNDSQGDKYSRLVNNPSARKRFIDNMLKFLEKYNFDGLDLDWEYPKCWQVDCKKGPASDKSAFAALVKELKQAFRPKGYLLSSAVSPSKTVIDAGYDVPALAENLDWVAVMTYDFHGQWDKKTGHVAPLFYHPEDDVAFFNSNFSINYWISEGVPRRKIVMGMPLYGQSFRLENETNNGLNAPAPGPGEAGPYTRAAGFLAYYEICDNIKNKGWTVVQDPLGAMGPYAYKGNQWVSFDDKNMIRKKSEYIRSMDIGGGMIWALDLDDFKARCGEGRHPLLTIIRNVLADPGNGEQTAIEGPNYESSKPSDGEERKPEEESDGDKTMTTLAPSGVSETSSQAVVCYFTNWAWYRQGNGKYLPSDIDPNLCTHIVYGFAVLDREKLVIKPHDSWADIDNKFYEKVTALKSKGVKVLIAIGGWNDSQGDKYSRLVNDPAARKRFIEHVLKFIEDNNFDGLDLDWEYPKCWQVDCNKGPASDKAAFADLVRELKEAFRYKGYLLSSAVSPSKRVIDAGYDVPALSKYLDWIAVMCYDYHGQWDKITGHVAPMYAHPEDVDNTFNTNFTIHYWIEQGADRRKLVLGMPMYGQSFSLADREKNGLNAPSYGGGEAGEETRARGFLAYYEICDRVLKNGWRVVRDRQGRIGPYAYKGDQWVSFDDAGMIRHKSEWARAMRLGGAMIWALDLDDFKGDRCQCGPHPLLSIINTVLRGYKKPQAPTCKPLGIDSPQSTTQSHPTSSARPSQITPLSPITPPPAMTPPLPCDGRLFSPHPVNCHQYYLCNQGQLQLQSCPSGLYWNMDHCDWPENTECHPDGKMKKQQNRLGMNRHQSNRSTMHGDGKYTPADIDPKLCTHINYAFAVLDADTLTIKPRDPWIDIDNNGSDFQQLVAELSSRLRPHGLILSAAVAASQKALAAGAYGPQPHLLQHHLDWMAVMAYDYHGHWDGRTGHAAPLVLNGTTSNGMRADNSSITYWLEKGVSPKKLVLGVPFYGQSYTLQDPSRNRLNESTTGPGAPGEFTGIKGFLAFYEICERANKNGWRVVRDPEGKMGTYATHSDQWVSYDDVAEVQQKAKYAMDLGLGGVMAWAPDLDDFRGKCGCGKYPLLKALGTILEDASAASLLPNNCT
nr:unnamed protein product [Callosobruchus analis]